MQTAVCGSRREKRWGQVEGRWEKGNKSGWGAFVWATGARCRVQMMLC